MVAAVLIAAVMTAIAAELALTLRASHRRARALRGEVDALRSALTRTAGELRAAERRLARRERVTQPLIKTRALRVGTARAAQTFRNRRRAGIV